MTSLNGKVLTGLKKAELQAECELRGLVKGGNKSDLITRLEDWILKNDGKSTGSSVGESVKKAVKKVGKKADKVPCTKLCKPGRKSMCPNRKKKGQMSMTVDGGIELLACWEVERRLTQMGVDVEKVSKCILAGIQCGAIQITGKKEELKKVIHKGRGECCDHEIPATLEEVLYQGDYGGDVYEDFADHDKSELLCKPCEETEPVLYFLTGSCRRDPDLNSGKFHNHCTECPGYGVCLGDYRDSHCDGCGRHGYRGDCYNKRCRNYTTSDDNDDCVIS